MDAYKSPFRKSRKNPGLIPAVLLTIALCFPTGLLISAAVNSMLLRYFPFPMPDQLESMFSSKSILNLRFKIFGEVSPGPLRARTAFEDCCGQEAPRSGLPG